MKTNITAARVLAAMQSLKLYSAQTIFYELGLSGNSKLKVLRKLLLGMAREGLLKTSVDNHAVYYSKP